MNAPNPHTLQSVAAASGTVVESMAKTAEAGGLVPTGKPAADLGQAAYLVFSGLAVAATFVALRYGQRALNSLGRVLNTEGTRIASGAVQRMSERIQQRFGLNEYSPEGRAKLLGAMCSDWVRLGKDDATGAAGIRALGLLEEPVNHLEILQNHFSPASIAKERGQKKQPVFRRTIEYAETATALVQGASVSPSDRDKMLAALVLHLPEPGGTVLQEHVALINSVGALGARLMQGLRLLAPKTADLEELKNAPGPKLLLASDQPLDTLYKVDSTTLYHRHRTPGTAPAPNVTVNANAAGSVIILDPGSLRRPPRSIELSDDDVREADTGANLLREASSGGKSSPPVDGPTD